MSEEKQVSRRDFLKIAGAGSGAALASAVAACAPAAQPPAQPAEEKPEAPAVVGKPFSGVTVKTLFISGANYDELYKLIPDWEEETGATVEVVFRGNGFETDKRLVADFAAGTVDYDVCWDHTSFFSQYVKADGLEPLDDYFSGEELSDFIPRMVDAGRRDGKLWLIPRHFDISAMHYRTDLMGDREPPETWDEFKELALELNDPSNGIFGTQSAGKEEALSGRFYEVLVAEGGNLFDDEWEPIFNSDAGVKAATMFYDLYQAGAMPPDMTNFLWEDVAKNFANGSIALYSEWYGWYSFFQDPESSKVAGKFDLARLPKGDGGIHSGWAGAHAFSITKASQNKEAAASLIKHLTNVEGNETEARLGFTVARESVMNEAIQWAEDSDNPLDKKRLELVLMQAQEDFRTPPLIAEWLPMSNILYPILQKIILGDVGAQEGLDDAVDQVRQLMASSGYYG